MRTTRGSPYFVSEEACVQFLPDGRNVRVVDHDIDFFDSFRLLWSAPVGTETDGGSVPWIAQPLVGGPFESKARDGYILHDRAYSDAPAHECTPFRAFRSQLRSFADGMLYDAAIARGMNRFSATAVYLGVRIGGWWPWMQHALCNAKK